MTTAHGEFRALARAAQPVSWSELYAARRATAVRFGRRVFDLPIVRRVIEVVRRDWQDGRRLLEVGAGDRSLCDKLRQAGLLVRYESQDIDPRGEHDFCDLSQVQGPYDRIVALEVIEHLPLEEIGPWLARLAELLAPGGLLILSTPNTFYPPAYLRDATHRTPLCYDELGALVSLAGLDPVYLARVYHDPVHRKVLRRYLLGWLFRTLGIDYARQIVLVARKAP